MIADIVQERCFAAQQRRRDVRPRIERDRKYALMRAWGTVIQTDLQVQAVIADIYAGRPVGYSTFLAYDEVAHHSGVERADALAVLRRVDRQIGRIAAAARDAPRPYRFVVLSDHGQSQGETFLDRYGISLEDLVQEACEADAVEAEAAHTNEALGYLSASLTEASGADSAAGRAVGAATRGRQVDGAVQLGEDGARRGRRRELPELSVMASGCLGLDLLPARARPGDARADRGALAGADPGAARAPGDRLPAGALRARRRHRDRAARAPTTSTRDSVEGEDPLAPFGPNAARHVKRTDGFPHCPDIVVNSTYWADTDEVAAFEELVGSHGGMGGGQSFPFALVPADWRRPRSRWSAPRRCTPTSAAGSPTSATRPTATGRAGRPHDPRPGDAGRRARTRAPRTYTEIDAGGLTDVFAAPRWLRDVGLTAWLLVGVALFLVGAVSLLALTETIVLPVIAATVLASVASPLVGWLQRHRVPRLVGAILVLLAIVVLGAAGRLHRAGGHWESGWRPEHPSGRRQERDPGLARGLGREPRDRRAAKQDASSSTTQAVERAARRRRRRHPGALLARLLPGHDGPQPPLPARGRPQDPSLGGAPHGRSRPGGPHDRLPDASVAAGLLPRRDARRGIQCRRGGRGSAGPGRPAGGHDRAWSPCSPPTSRMSAPGRPGRSRS